MSEQPGRNFHSIVGPNGMCECGVKADGTVVTCGNLLENYVQWRLAQTAGASVPQEAAAIAADLRCEVTTSRCRDYGCAVPGATLMSPGFRCGTCRAYAYLAVTRVDRQGVSARLGTAGADLGYSRERLIADYLREYDLCVEGLTSMTPREYFAGVLESETRR